MSITTSDKRKTSTVKYIDSLQQQYSKINTVRVELSYKKPHSDNTTLNSVNADFNKMLNNTRSKPTIFADKIGYICKKEYAKDKGIHMHAIFIFDGQKIIKDTYKADQIGKYWAEDITNGAGTYHNCNREKYKYKGIGMLDHRDKEKRKILDDKVISYLCKEKQGIDKVKTNAKDRAFTRGTIAKPKANIGRPRGGKD